MMKKWTDKQIYEIPIIVVSHMVSNNEIDSGKALSAKKDTLQNPSSLRI